MAGILQKLFGANATPKTIEDFDEKLAKLTAERDQANEAAGKHRQTIDFIEAELAVEPGLDLSNRLERERKALADAEALAVEVEPAIRGLTRRRDELAATETAAAAAAARKEHDDAVRLLVGQVRNSAAKIGAAFDAIEVTVPALSAVSVQLMQLCPEQMKVGAWPIDIFGNDEFRAAMTARLALAMGLPRGSTGGMEGYADMRRRADVLGRVDSVLALVEASLAPDADREAA